MTDHAKSGAPACALPIVSACDYLRAYDGASAARADIARCSNPSPAYPRSTPSKLHPFQKNLDRKAPGENRPSRHNLMPNRARIGHARASSGDKPDARKNRPTLRRRGFLHKIAPSLMEAATHRADNSDEARYRLLLNDVVE